MPEPPEDDDDDSTDECSSGEGARWLSSRPALLPPRLNLFSPFSGPLSERTAYPPHPVCAHCAKPLGGEEARWGSGLCDTCYNDCEKECHVCFTRLQLKHHYLRSGLCDTCYDCCEKVCRTCDRPLRLHELHWGSALCDDCYHGLLKNCRTCTRRLATRELRWGTGLCNLCYDASRPADGFRCHACLKPLDPKRPSAAIQWGSGLCDGCYAAFEKECRLCQASIELGQLHWGTGLCEKCHALERSQNRELAAAAASQASGTGDTVSHALSPDVRMLISAQLIFYLAPALMLPSLYLFIERQPWGGSNASTVYAAVLSATTVVAMAAPVPLGYWAEKRGEREVYAGATLVATMAAVGLAVSPSAAAFAAAWALLSVPISLRGVRAVYFARRVLPADLSRVGQLASAAGLVGALAGPLLSQLPLDLYEFALLAALLHALTLSGFMVYLPARRRAPSNACTPARGHGGHTAYSASRPHAHSQCERCGRDLSAHEERWGKRLCDRCWDTWFMSHQRKTLFWCCAVAFLLEFSINAGVLTTFQPIAVSRFGWTEQQLAAVNFFSALASIAVSLASAHLRLPEWLQACAAAGLYLVAVILGTLPPPSEWRLVVALVIGLKAQVLFMAPFTAIFSHLIGGQRVTNALTTLLCLAPLVGAALGTAIAPFCLPFAGTPFFLLISLPACIANATLLAVWRSAGAPSRRTADCMPAMRREDSRRPFGEARSSKRASGSRGSSGECRPDTGGGPPAQRQPARTLPSEDGRSSIRASQLRQPLLAASEHHTT